LQIIQFKTNSIVIYCITSFFQHFVHITLDISQLLVLKHKIMWVITLTVWCIFVYWILNICLIPWIKQSKWHQFNGFNYHVSLFLYCVLQNCGYCCLTTDIWIVVRLLFSKLQKNSLVGNGLTRKPTLLILAIGINFVLLSLSQLLHFFGIILLKKKYMF
jgi:hypothetical protein